MALLIIQILLLIVGIGIATIWTKDIFTNPEIDLFKGFFTARDHDSGSLFWPHWMAEYLTALALIASIILIFLNIEFGKHLLPFAVGALFYTSLNSLGWAFAKKERYAYAFPMLFALAVSAVCFFILIFS